MNVRSTYIRRSSFSHWLPILLLSLLVNSAFADADIFGDVNLNPYGNQADAFTRVEWSWYDYQNTADMRSYAEIQLEYSVVDTDTVVCENFDYDSDQQCIAIAEANSCTDDCAYSGQGEGERRLGVLPWWASLGTWGLTTKVCQHEH